MANRLGAAVAAAAMAMTLVGCGGADGSSTSAAPSTSSSPSQTRLDKAYDDCTMNLTTDEAATISSEDEGHTLSFDTKPGGVTGVACVFQSIKTPDRITTNIDSTTAMMGRQHAEADGITYEWSYHPDSGLQLVMFDR